MTTRHSYVERLSSRLHGTIDEIIVSMGKSDVSATRELLMKGKKALDEVINQIKIDDDR